MLPRTVVHTNGKPHAAAETTGGTYNKASVASRALEAV